MADSKKMSIEDVLAACRQQDGDGESPSSEAATPAPSVGAPAGGDAPAESAPAKPAAPSAGPKSTADILAAARGEVAPGGGSGSSSGPKSTADILAAARSETSGGAKPAAPASGKKASEMSVAEMLAAARAETGGGKGGAKAAAPAKTSAAPKPKAAPVKAEASSAKAAPSGPKDTASILAAARSGAKAGPMSKAEAAERNQPVATRPAKAKPVAPPMPTKPDYARAPASQSAATSSERRGFLSAFFGVLVASPLAVGFASLAVTHLLWVLGLARYMFPNILTEPPTRFKVGFPSVYAPGQVETKFKAQFGVWIVKSEYEGQPQIFALKSVCTHLGCTPNWLDGEQKFKCPCHGSGFYKDGINFEGPAPRPLERYAIQVADDGQLEVDKSQKFQQELGQWTDPSSFVPV